MDGIQFADGFDAPDRLAFGLAAPQLITVVAGCLVAFAVLHAPLPGLLTVPLAFVLVLSAAALGWVRLGGRPALDWALFAACYALRPRSGSLVLTTAASRPAIGSEDAAPAAPVLASNIVQLHRHWADHTPRARPAPPRAAPGRSGARRLVFYSLKGGTGRTTLSTEVAAWLASCGSGDCVLVDCDLRSASVAGRLGLAHSGFVDYAVSPPDDRRVDEFLVQHASGLRVLLGPAKPADPCWPVTPAVLREVLRELDLGGARTVVVDVSAELSDVTRAALRAADDVMIVVVPTATGIQDAYRTTELLRALGLRDRLRYVVNRARHAVDVSVAMHDLGGDIIAEIPEDPALVDAENRHSPAVLSATGGAGLELRRLAARMLPATHAAAR